MRKTKTHLYFWDGVYCQWYESSFMENGINYLSAEHYMMAHKAKLFDEVSIYEEILLTPIPSRAKELGRSIKNFDKDKWDARKLDVVTQGNYLKFSSNSKLKEIILKDRNLVIVEASPVDKIWGVGLHYSDDKILNDVNWRGENLLGIAIMKARDRIIKES